MISTLALLTVTFLADPKAEILKKLDDAKSDYKLIEAAHLKSIEKSLDALEEAARKDGSKQAVEVAKQRRESYKLWGEFPTTVPRTAMIEARSRLVKAYDEASRDLIKAKADEEAAKLEKEYHHFLVESGVLAGKYSYLTKLKPFDVKMFRDAFASGNTKSPFSFKGFPCVHSIYHHANSQDNVRVSYPLAGKWQMLRTTVGVLQNDENTPNPGSALTFEVLGDGRSLWKSKPVDKKAEFQVCEVNVAKVKVLTLVVHCSGLNHNANAVWFEPMLIDP